MPYFKFQSDIYGEHGIAGYPALPEGISFLAGRIIAEPLPTPLVFSVSNPGDRPPRHLLGTMIPVASAQLVDALRASGIDNLQAFPAVLRNEAVGVSWNGFFAFNIVGLVDAVDEGASTFDTIMDGDEFPRLVDFRELVLAERKVGSHDLFRLVHSPVDMFISGRVRDELIGRRPPDGWGITTIEVPVR